MKKTHLRILTLLVALAMLVCCFAGCGNTPKEEEAVLDEEISGTNTVTDQDVENDTPAVVDDDKITVVEPDDSKKPADNDDDEKPADDEKEEDPSNDEGGEPADEKEDEDEDFSDLFDDTEKDYSEHFVVASYNVQIFQKGKAEEYDGIAAELKECGAAIVGLQEVDCMNTRSGQEDQLKVIAEKAGYEYYKFTPAYIENYGTAVMSKYPIKEHTVTKFETQDGEERSFSRSVIDMDGKTIHFYNTHLCLGGAEKTGAQMAEIIKMIRKMGDKNVIITGDMNCTAKAFIPIFSAKDFIPLNGGDTFLSYRNTHPEGKASKSPIDNIIVSTDWDYYMEEDTQVGILVSRTEWSDHNMIYTYLKFKD